MDVDDDAVAAGGRAAAATDDLRGGFLLIAIGGRITPWQMTVFACSARFDKSSCRCFTLRGNILHSYPLHRRRALHHDFCNDQTSGGMIIC